MSSLKETPDGPGFQSERILVQSWTAFLDGRERLKGLIEELEPVLTPNVLRHLPEPLQISEATDAVARWVADREEESDAYVVREKTSSTLLGLLILAEFPEPNGITTIHLGYLFAESAWGNGYATELLLGLVRWMGEQNRQVQFLAGVEKGNAASARVLQKSGFERSPGLSSNETDMFRLTLR